MGILWDSIHVISKIIEVIIAVKCSFLEISKNLAAIWTQQEITLDDKTVLKKRIRVRIYVQKRALFQITQQHIWIFAPKYRVTCS